MSGARRRWIAAWAGAAAIATANGAIREGVYAKRVGEESANQISVVTGIAAFAVYFRALQRRWPLETSGTGWRSGQPGR